MSETLGLLTSAGQLGLDPRATWRRIRYIYPEFVADPIQLEAVFAHLSSERRRLHRGRCILQAVIARKPLGPLLGQHLETYEPLGPDTALITVAENAKRRQGSHSIDEIVREVDEAVSRNRVRAFVNPTQRLRELEGPPHNLTFTMTVGADDVSRLTGLWQSTFGWRRGQVTAFRTALAEQSSLPPQDRSLWFVGARNSDGDLVGAAMAERLDMLGPDGTRIPLVESTEWATAPEMGRRGLMTVLVALLNAQLLSDLRSPAAHIFAECNYDARAYEVGLRAFMSIPEHEIDGLHVPQIHRQNVGVGGELRSFVRAVLVPTQTVMHEAAELLEAQQHTL